jgi:Tfp pilus assembly protein PilV
MTMLNPPATPPDRPRRRRPRSPIARASARQASRLEPLRSRFDCVLSRVQRAHSGLLREDGFLLIEALISAVLVAVIVIGMFNGFDAANKAGTDERAHNEAVLLAEQSQEQLRSDPVTTLDKLQTASHSYTTTVDGTEYTVTQEASPSNGTTETTCNVTEVTKQTAGNVLITSKVSWALLKAKSLTKERPAVSLSSIITPPTGSGLEIDAGNQPAPTAGVSGITAIVTYLPTGSSTLTTAEGTTNSNGCFVFEGIPSTAASIAISEKAGYVTPAGLLKWPTKEVSVAANLTTHYPVTYNQGGAIKANFTYKGSGTYEGKTVTGDTFVVFNTEMRSEPNFEVGSTSFTHEAGGEERYTPTTGTYASSATTAKESLYSAGDLFPFITKWAVWAGDCIANNPTTYIPSLSGGSVAVSSGATSEATVPMSIINLAVRNGTLASPGTLNSEELTATVTDTACSSSAVPNNATAAKLAHAQKTKSGALTSPFMPFGAYSLSVERSKKRYTYGGENKTEAGTSPTIYLGARTQTEIASSISTYKEEIKKDPEKIAALKKLNEEEAKPRETKEAEERAQWKKELECYKNLLCFLNIFEKKVSESEYNAKISNQTKTREAAEKTEKEKQAPRNAEIKALEEALKTAETNLKAAEKEQKEEEEDHVKVEEVS